jgi:acetyl esterase/lipase
MILPGEEVHGSRRPRTSSRLHPSAATHTVRNASAVAPGENRITPARVTDTNITGTILYFHGGGNVFGSPEASLCVT